MSYVVTLKFKKFFRLFCAKMRHINRLLSRRGSLFKILSSEMNSDVCEMNSAKRKDVICLFDVDGTITPPRQKISNSMELFLERLKHQCIVGLVGGSDVNKIAEQLGGIKAISKYDYVFSENGLVAYKNGDLFHTQSLTSHFDEETLQKIINSALRNLSEILLPFKRGTFIEFRKGMINISPVGRNCTQSERDTFEKYDKVHHVRANLIAKLKEEFPLLDLKYSIGGQVSFDVFPIGWDKTYCIKLLFEQNGIETIYFFGDKTYAGGNDHEIFEDPRTVGHSVRSPEDTMEQVKKIFQV